MAAPNRIYELDDYVGECLVVVFLSLFIVLGAAIVFAQMLAEYYAPRAVPDDQMAPAVLGSILLGIICIGIGVAEAEQKWQQDAPRRRIRDITERTLRDQRAIADRYIRASRRGPGG